MGQIFLSLPQAGQPNTTEDPKLVTDLSTIQTVINGNIDDTNLSSPNNGVRRKLLHGCGYVPGGKVSAQYIFLSDGQTITTSGVGVFSPPHMWLADSGLSSNPTDFQVATLNPYCRIRAFLGVNSTAPGITFTIGIYLITGVGGGSNVVSFTFGAPLAGATVAVASPAAGSITAVETPQFAMPTAAGAYALGVALSGTTAANSATVIASQLYGYNA